MTYGTYRATLYGMVGLYEHRAKVQRHQSKADRVVKTLTQLVAERGSAWALNDEAGLRKAARSTFGILPAVFAPLLIQLLEILLPVLLQWLREQLSNATFGGTQGLDEMMQGLRRQAAMLRD